MSALVEYVRPVPCAHVKYSYSLCMGVSGSMWTGHQYFLLPLRFWNCGGVNWRPYLRISHSCGMLPHPNSQAPPKSKS